jgi:hypothetical protein
MLRGSRHIAALSIAFLVFTAAANSQVREKPHAGTLRGSVEPRVQLAQTAPAVEQPTNPNGQHRSIQDGMKAAVNPTGRDYGVIFTGWQSVIVSQTIGNWVFWVGFLSLTGLFSGGLYFWWYADKWADREVVFERAMATTLGQRNAAKWHANEAIDKYNELLFRYDQLRADNSGVQVDLPEGGVLVADQNDDTAGAKGDTPEDAVVVLEDGAVVEKVVIPGQTAAVFKIDGEEFIKKVDANRQLDAERQKSRRISAKNQQLQDTLFKYER